MLGKIHEASAESCCGYGDYGDIDKGEEVLPDGDVGSALLNFSPAALHTINK